MKHRHSINGFATGTGALLCLRLCRTLGAINEHRALNLWIQALDDQHEVTRREAVTKLFEVNDARATEALLVTLEKTTDQRLKTLIVFGFGERQELRAVESLSRLLKTGTSKQKELTATTLGKIGDSRALDALVAALSDNTVNVRRNSVQCSLHCSVCSVGA